MTEEGHEKKGEIGSLPEVAKWKRKMNMYKKRQKGRVVSEPDAHGT